MSFGTAFNSAPKYRHLTWRQEGIAGAKPGMLAFMGVGTGDVNHTGLVTECGTVLHSSKSRGCVVETELTAKDGWNGLGVHRNINVGREADEDTTSDIQAGDGIHRLRAEGAADAEKPDIRGEYMQMLPDGAVITVLEERAGWFKTTYKGYTGWVSASIAAKPRATTKTQGIRKGRRKTVSRAHSRAPAACFFRQEAPRGS